MKNDNTTPLIGYVYRHQHINDEDYNVTVYKIEDNKVWFKTLDDRTDYERLSYFISYYDLLNAPVILDEDLFKI